MGCSRLSINAIIIHTGIISEDLTGQIAVTNTVPTNCSLKAEKIAVITIVYRALHKETCFLSKDSVQVRLCRFKDITKGK